MRSNALVLEEIFSNWVKVVFFSIEEVLISGCESAFSMFAAANLLNPIWRKIIIEWFQIKNFLGYVSKYGKKISGLKRYF